uniref:Uncharacterized protein n=1 Tax=Physcomitrium patens TaxID=3218 RepID=A0A2K1JYD7_PHYPA|nr:hypothetical protein PHYPA_013663 [Physcomitrium patens]
MNLGFLLCDQIHRTNSGKYKVVTRYSKDRRVRNTHAIFSELVLVLRILC